MKTCVSCHEEKPFSSFWHDRWNEDDGYATKCIDCHKRYQRQSRTTGRQYRTWLRWLPPILLRMQRDASPEVRKFAQAIFDEIPEATQKKLIKRGWVV